MNTSPVSTTQNLISHVSPPSVANKNKTKQTTKKKESKQKTNKERKKQTTDSFSGKSKVCTFSDAAIQAFFFSPSAGRLFLVVSFIPKMINYTELRTSYVNACHCTRGDCANTTRESAMKTVSGR